MWHFGSSAHAATTVDQIARELGVTKAAIYHHHPSKEAILTAGVDRALLALWGVRALLDQRRAFDRDAASVLQQAVDGGELPADLDVRLMTRLMMGMNNWLTEWYQPDSPLSAADVIRMVTGFTMAGLTAPAAQRHEVDERFDRAVGPGP